MNKKMKQSSSDLKSIIEEKLHFAEARKLEEVIGKNIRLIAGEE